MKTSEELLKAVNQAISSIPYDRQPYSLYEPIEYVLSLGGKRIRPVLMLLAYNLYREHPEQIMSNAIGLETYHNYTLLHDDLMDNADLRRGHQTVHKRWNSNAAILSGDSMLVLSYQHMTRCQPQYLEDVLTLFTTTALEIGEGQQYDMEFETRSDVSEAEYINMIRLKTSVLLACALKMGAILADAPQADQEALYNFGVSIGLAFQLQDDYLDVYGDTRVFGKVIGGDIVSNKKTYMLINAINMAQGDTRDRLDHWLSLQTFDRDEKIEAVTSIYNTLGIDRLAQEKIESYFAEALRHLDSLSVADDRKTELLAYTKKLMRREK